MDWTKPGLILAKTPEGIHFFLYELTPPRSIAPLLPSSPIPMERLNSERIDEFCEDCERRRDDGVECVEGWRLQQRRVLTGFCGVAVVNGRKGTMTEKGGFTAYQIQ